MFQRLKQITFNKNISRLLYSSIFTFKNIKRMQNQKLQTVQPQQQQQKPQQQQKVLSRQQNKTFKVKCGIFFGYNGEKYLGMQYQRETQNTIQNTLHKLLVDEGFILKTNADILSRISWSRAARTDKRVHALCNGISVKLQISEKFLQKEGERQIDFDKLRNHLNAQLPIDIRIFSIMRVAKGFDMRHDALTRVYNYIIPLYIFQKYEDFKGGKIPSEAQQTQILQKLNNLCKLYLGTHNFHNFTKGYKQNNPQCERYMISMKAEPVQKEVFQRYWQMHKDQQNKRDQQQQRYVRFTLVGQSFIYHQIRKMIGLLIKIFAEGLEGETIIKQAFTPEKFEPYLAPGEGLYLNRMTFECYNRRKQKNNQKTVELSQEDQQRVLKFREYLESQILHHQVEQKVFTSWLTNKFEYKAEQNQEQQAEVSMEQEGKQDKNQQKQEQDQNQNKKQKFNKNNKKWHKRN